MTKDLYAKQRVRDPFLEEHELERRELLGYYENRYRKGVPMPIQLPLFVNPYRVGTLRIGLLSAVATTAVLTGFLAILHPVFALATVYDWFLLGRAMMQLNQTVQVLMLDANKTEIIVNKLNFLGLFRQARYDAKSLREIRYLGIRENNTILFGELGFPPTLLRLLRDSNPEAISKRGQFRRFHAFMLDDVMHLVPADALPDPE